MEHPVRVGHGVAQDIGIADVGQFERHGIAMRRFEPLDIPLDSGARQVVVDDDPVTFAHQTVGQIGADETGAAGDDNRLDGAGGGYRDRTAEPVERSDGRHAALFQQAAQQLG
jgi:hypothetical protein